VFEIPFNMTVQTRGLLEVDDEKLSSQSLLTKHSANHSRMLHCTDEVPFYFHHNIGDMIQYNIKCMACAQMPMGKHFGLRVES